MRRFSLFAILLTFLTWTPTSAQEVTLHHDLRYDAEPSPLRWRVSLEIEGVSPDEGPFLELSNWGEWNKVDAYVPQELASSVPLAESDPGLIHLKVDED